MKKLIFLFLFLALFAVVFTQTANAQVTVSGSNTKDGTYTSLTNAAGAFLAINSADQSGKTITITITANVTNEAGTNALTGAAGMWTSLKIIPSGVRTISGSPAAPLINFNGADNVTIDGLNSGGNSLTISNISDSDAAGTSTIRFINDASNNTIQNCTLKGAESVLNSPTTGSGIVLFSTTTGSTGNDGNTIDHNNITNANASRPINAIYSLGTAAKENSGNTISNNNIYDFLSPFSASCGINLGNYNTAWTISGNSFYETASYNPRASVEYRVINIENTSGINFAVSNNFIGGSAERCGANSNVTSWTKTKGSSPYYENKFYAIYLSVGTGTASNIQGNTIKNFSYTNSSSANWTGIQANSGDINIGTTTGNTIGEPTESGSILFTAGATGANFYGINIAGNGTVDAENNKVGSITVSNAAASATNFYGINKTNVAGTTTISNNTIGSTVNASSINASSISSGNAQSVYGIYSAGTGISTISGNTISKLTNATTNTTAATVGCINGIVATGGTNTITNNTVRDLTIANANTVATFQASVGGIVLSNTTAAAQTITGNTVYGLSNTYASFAGSVMGLYYNGSTTASTVSNNFINSLSVSGGSSTTANIYGFKIDAGATTYSNNIVTIGGNTKTTLYGIYETGTVGNDNNLYFNTIYIGGSLNSGTSNKSYCLYSAVNTNTRNFRNNIFSNARSTSSGSGLHYAMYIVAPDGTLTCNYNDYQASGTGGKLGYYGADKTTSVIVTGQDENSINTSPSFLNAGGTLATHYIPVPPVSLPGTTLAEVTTDYSARTRAVTPTMGAFEFMAPVAITASAGIPTGSYSTLSAAFAKITDGTHKGAITIKINASTTETGSAVLYAGTRGNASYVSVNIYPTATGLSINGSFAAPLIDLNGADNVTIDGRVNQAGAKDLVISNTSTANTTGTSTIRFLNDATNNTVKYCKVKGSTTDPAGGILFFSDTDHYGTTGNDDNTIDNNDITNAADANRPINAIYSLGASAMENSGNTISNNNIFDFLNRGSASYYGVNLGNYTTAWTISGNSFYETTSFVPTSSGAYRVINIENTSGKNFTVSNNFIGGSAPSCGGANPWKKTRDTNNPFYGIYISVGTETASNVQGNTLANFDYSNISYASWYGIYATGGVNIGTTAGNVIGNASGTVFFKFTGGQANSNFYGIYLSDVTGNVQNNSIATITVANNSAGNSSNFYGVYVSGATPSTIANNTIGSNTVLNSINTTSASTNNAQLVYGIYSLALSALTITGNTIANLTNGTTNTSTSYFGLVNGIYLGSGSNVVSNNTIRDLTIANANNSATYQVSVGGIVLNNTTVGNVQTITGNTIYNLSNTYASFAGSVAGLYYKGPVTPSIVSGNFVHSLSVTGASSTAASISGIYIASGVTTYLNNIINLGGNTQTLIYGISETGAADNNNTLYFNTVYIGGTLASGVTNKSYSLYSAVTTNTRNFKNNIFYNARSTTGGTSLHYAAYFNYAVNTNLTLANNDYYAPGTGGVLGYYNGANVTSVSSMPINDANSSAINPLFASAGGTLALHYYPSATLTGIAGTGVLTDYSNYTRATPKMGAVEFDSAPVVSGNTVEVYNGATLLASYLNLHDAFDNINDGTHTGSIIVKVTGSQMLSASAVLNASGTGSASYTDVTMYPTVTGLTISGNGNFTEPLIDLNGADNVSIDGRVGGTGATKSLTIVNPSIVGPSIRFVNDAVGNTVKYCTIKGSSSFLSSGIICFGTTNGTTGNDGNTIDNNNITNALDANRPVNAIFSFGTGTGSENSENTISNNNIYDFLSRGTASFGINLSTNSTAWTITGNSFYETASFVPTSGVDYRVININNTANGQNFTISNNFIGGMDALCGGSAWTKAGTWSNTFYGIYMNVGSTIASNIQGNTIKNIAYTTATINWYGINVESGLVNIGTTAGNTIGSATGNGSITVTAALSGFNFYGIKTASQVIVQNNILGSITVANLNAAYSSNFYGIYCTFSGANPISIKNNVIGSTDGLTTNSIWANSAATANAQVVYGIYSSAWNSLTITDNTISKMTNGTTNATVGTIGAINGINVSYGSIVIDNNVVRDLTIANANNSVTDLASVGGIVMLNTYGGVIANIIGNTIYNLSNTYANFAGAVIGIYSNNQPIASTVSGNFIHSLLATSGNLYGIKINAGATTYSNNIVNLGGNTLNTIYGIYETGAANNNNNLYFNTVYIGGTPASGSNKSYCLYSAVTTNTRNFRNNIFYNARSTTGGTSLHYAAYFNYAVNTNLTLANNDYYAPGTGGVLGYYNGANVTSVSSMPNSDANSLAIDPLFATPGGTAVANYYPSATLPGVSGVGTLIDFNEYSRNATAPKMGALESSSPTNKVDLYVGGLLQASFENIKAAFDKINDGTYTGAIVLKINDSQELSTTAVLNPSGIGSASYTSVQIYPTAPGLIIYGNMPAPLIDLNGADHVVIDGRVNATGTAKDLIITNTCSTDQAETSTIRLINGATNNVVKYCKLKGSSISWAGIVYFAATSVTSGNNNNLIENNDITCAADANRPMVAVSSFGQAGTENSNNTISNNNFYDFQNRTKNSFGIWLTNSSAWTISGNSFYETTLIVPTGPVVLVILTIDAETGQNFTVSNNYIGGSTANCGGPAWKMTSAYYTQFQAIDMNVGSIVTSNIQGNTIKNFDFSNTATYSDWIGMECSRGNINVGTTTGNTIGSPTGNGSITLMSGASNGRFWGICITNYSVSDVRNNTIGSITFGNFDNTASTSIYAIYKSSYGTATISNNLIGSTDPGTTNSIDATSLATGIGNGYVQDVWGIYINGESPITVSGNTISKLMNRTTNTSGTLSGILNYSSIGGIFSNNFINNLSVTGATTASVNGIVSRGGIGTYSNNIISLGGTTATTIYGIYEAGSDNRLYFNTVYIGGSVGSGTNKSYALYSNASTGIRNFRNNIFSNSRSTTGGANLHYAAWFNYGTSANLTLSNNDYFTPGTGGVLGRYNSLDVTSVPLISGIDANSLAIDPLFASAGGNAAENYIPATVMAGIAEAGLPTKDYAGTTRAATPTMGAYEQGISYITWTGNTDSNWNTAGNWNPAHVPTATEDAVIPDRTNDPIVNEVPASPAVCKNLTIQTGAVVTIAAGKALTVNGTLTNNAGITGLVIQSASDALDGTGSLINGTAGVEGTVERYVSGDLWHLISPAATRGETVANFVGATQNGNLVARNANNYALAPWLESTGKWAYYKVAETNSGMFGSPAQGFQVMRANGTGSGIGTDVAGSGKLTFKGTLAATDFTIPVTKSFYGWNLIGNPYPCALDIAEFIKPNTANTAQLDPSYVAIYVANIADIDASKGYSPVLADAELKLAPGEGFFVKTMTGGGTISFTSAMKSNVAAAFKAGTVDMPTIKLTVEDGNGKFGTTVKYEGGATKGLDPGKDAGLFNGSASTFSLFTRLIEDNGVDFTVQALPDNNLETMVVPVGLVAAKGATVTFKATAANLPAGYKVVLEDKETATFTRLDEANSSYTISLEAASLGTGRFYLHTTELVSAIDDKLLNEFKVVPMPDQHLVRILGNFDLPATAKVYDMNGKLVATSVLTSQIENDIPLTNSASGVYLLNVESGNETKTVKFIWKRK
ncbi:MAG: T9SS type A sorting domain-containing protein [Mariniphaga sp.]